MSYDIHLEIDTGGECPHAVASWNYTSNCGPMFRHALGGDGLKDLSGMPAVDAIPVLDDAIANMERSPEAYKAMNPPNGWGSYEGALDLLREVRDGMIAHPRTTVSVSA